MGKDYPINFNLKAFDNASETIDKVNERFAKIGGSLQGFNNRFDILSQKTKAWKDALSNAGDKLTSVGKTMGLFVTAPLAALGAKMLHTAIEAEESASKFEQVFKAVDDAARNKAAESLASGFDMSTASAQEMIATNGLLLKDLGFTSEQALKTGTDMSKLAVQVAAFRNVQGGAEATAEIFRSALLGQTKGLKKLGIDITDVQIKQEALKMAQAGVRFETVEQAQAMVMQSLILKRTKDDQEDYAESQEKTANQMRVTSELFKELSTTIGKILIPVFDVMLKIGNGIMRFFLKMPKSLQIAVVVFAALVAAIAPLLIFFGTILTMLPSMIAGWAALSAASLPITGTMLLISAAILAIIAAFAALIVYWEPIKKFFGNLWDGVVEKTKAAFESIKNYFWDTFPGTMQFLSDMFSKIGEIIGAVYKFTGMMRGVGGVSVNNSQTSSPLAGAGGVAQTAQASAIGKSIVQEMRSTNDARVKIDFSNMPTGTKVSTSASSSPPILNLGSMGGSF